MQEVLLQMVEAGAEQHVVPHLVAGMASKNGKQAAAAAKAAREAFVQLGAGRDSLVAACVDLFGSSHAAVRAEAIMLARALFLVLGPSISSHFGSLRPIQVAARLALVMSQHLVIHLIACHHQVDH